MDKQTVIDHFGSPKATAEYLGITQQAVGQWPDTLTERVENRILAALARRGEAVPSGWLSVPTTTAQPMADEQHAATPGAVTRADLRPDLFAAPVLTTPPPPSANQQAA